MKDKMLIISQLPIWDIEKDSGKEVIQRSVEYFSRNFDLDVIAPGGEIEIKGGKFYRLNNSFQKKLGTIKFLGHLYNYIYFILFNIKVRNIIKHNNLNPQVVYMMGYWPAVIGYKMFKGKAILINRYFGVAWNKERFDSVREKARFLLKTYCYKHFGNFVIMTNDGTEGDLFLKKIGYPEERIHFLKNGISVNYDIDEALKVKTINRMKIDSDSMTFLTVSRLASWKRIDRSLELFSKLKGHGYSNIKLIIVGDGEEKERLKSLAAKFEIEDHVFFVGAVSRKDLPTYFDISDIFLSFYDYSNAGNPLFEAMSFGKCIVTLNNGTTCDFVDEQSAVLVSKPDLDEIVQKVREVLDDETLRLRFGKNAKKIIPQKIQTWEERFDHEERIIAEYISKIN